MEVPVSTIPGEKLATTQPFPTKPAPYDIQGLTHDDLIDFTPELRAAAIENLKDYKIGPLFNPPLHRDNDEGYKAAFWCPGDSGGVNIDGPNAADPETEPPLEHFEIEVENFSGFGGHGMSQANAWFGLPRAHGLELTTINEGLGAYFKTDRGVLVLRVREDNAYRLEAGDVILSIDSTATDSPSDMMRALRDVEPGSEIDIEIKRHQRDETLSVVVPENRLGYR